MKEINIPNAMNSILDIVSRTNKYIDETSPWILYKEGNIERLTNVMYNLYNSIRKISVLFYPFMPDTCNNIYEQLGLKEEEITFDKLKDNLDYNNKVTEKGVPLFNRLDANVEIPRLIDLMKVN